MMIIDGDDGWSTVRLAECKGRSTMIRFVAARSIDWCRGWWWSGYRKYGQIHIEIHDDSCLFEVVVVAVAVAVVAVDNNNNNHDNNDPFRDTSKCTIDSHNMMIDSSSSSSTVLVVVVIVVAVVWCCDPSSILLLQILSPVPCAYFVCVQYRQTVVYST